MIVNSDQAMDVLRAQYAALTKECSPASVRLFYDFLGAMVNVYMLELVSCTPDQLQFKQGCLKQCLQMQRSLLPDGELPKI